MFHLQCNNKTEGRSHASLSPRERPLNLFYVHAVLVIAYITNEKVISPCVARHELFNKARIMIKTVANGSRCGSFHESLCYLHDIMSSRR